MCSHAIPARGSGGRSSTRRFLEERSDALWKRSAIEACRVAAAPELGRIVVAVDPPASSGEGSDACGIVAAGIGKDGFGYVLNDATAGRLSPARWAKRAIDLFHRLEADRIVAEVNQGGEMVEAVIRNADSGCPLRRCTPHAENGSAPNRSRHSTSRGASDMSARSRIWRTRCATFRSADCRRGARPTGSTR